MNAAKIIVIDAGNTFCKAALFIDGSIVARAKWLAGSDPPDMPAARTAGPMRALVSSVNPAAEGPIRSWASRMGVEAAFVPADVPYPVPLRIDEPAGVGPDRVLAAAAAVDLLDAPCIVVGAGTAVTVDLADPVDGFLGGSIMPGPFLMAKSLATGTGLLPLVEPRQPASWPGKNTADAINAGVMLGAAGAVKEIVALARKMRPGAELVLTGGMALFFADALEGVSLLEPDLVLRGLVLAAGRV